MAKKKRVTVVRNERLGRSVEIFVTEGGQFYAKLGEEQVYDTLLSEVKSRAEAWLKETDDLVWKPVIVVNVSPDDERRGTHHITNAGSYLEHQSRFDLTFYRVEVCDQPKGKKLWRPFLVAGVPEARVEWLKNYGSTRQWDDAKTEAEQRRVNGQDVSEFRISEGDVFIPYTEAHWAALEAMKKQIMAMSTQLKTFLNEDNAVRALTQVAQKLMLIGPGELKALEAPKPLPVEPKKFIRLKKGV